MITKDEQADPSADLPNEDEELKKVCDLICSEIRSFNEQVDRARESMYRWVMHDQREKERKQRERKG